MPFLSKYGVARHIYIPIIKRAVVDFAVSADWTPAAGDVKISKDGGAASNVTNLPTAITMGNTAMWDFSLTATEMQAAQIKVTVSDSATKAVEDQMFVIETYGNASAQHEIDLDQPQLDANVTKYGGTAGTFSGGRPEVNTTHWAGTAVGSTTVRADLINIAGAAVSTSTAQLGVNVVNAAGTAWNSGGITSGTFAAGAINNAAMSIDGSELTAIPWNASWDAEVQSEVQDAIEVNHLDHLIAVADPGGVVANSSFLAKLVSKSATPAFTSFDNTTDSLEAIRDNHPTNFSSLSISIGGVKIQPTNTIGDSILTDLYIPSIADAIWDEVLSGHLTAGTTGAAISTASGTLDAAGVRTAVGLASANLDTQLSGIAADLPQRVTKNTALSGFTFPMVLASDHVTGATGKTVTATRSIDGGAFASCANSVSEVSGGFYKIDLSASDLNGNTITLLFTATACDPTRVTIITQPT